MCVADQPFPELRVAILLVFQALAFKPWGQTIMNDHPGFREYLLDRSTEKNKEGKEGKYAIIQTLADSQTVRDVFGDPYYVQLKTYCYEGPFYVRAQAQVAMEGESGFSCMGESFQNRARIQEFGADFLWKVSPQILN